jgi:hypothetical protein
MQERNLMAKRLQKLPDRAVAAVQATIQALSNLRYLDKEDGVEIEPPPELVESRKYYCEKLEQLLVDQRMSAAWDTMELIAAGKYEYQRPTQSSYCLVNFVIELTNTIGSTYANEKAMRSHEETVLQEISFHSAKILSLIDKLESTDERSLLHLDRDIFQGIGHGRFKERLSHLAELAGKAKPRLRAPVEEALSSRKSSQGDVKAHIRFLVTILSENYAVTKIDSSLRKAIAAFLDILVDSDSGVVTEDVTRIIKQRYPDLYIL